MRVELEKVLTRSFLAVSVICAGFIDKVSAQEIDPMEDIEGGRVSVTLSRANAIRGLVFGPRVLIPCPLEATAFQTTYIDIDNDAIFTAGLGLVETSGRLTPGVPRMVRTFIDTRNSDALYRRTAQVRCLTDGDWNNGPNIDLELKLAN